MTSINLLLQATNVILSLTTALLALAIALLSYAYTVKMNIRSEISQLEPLEKNDFRILATVNGVKWRPDSSKRNTIIQFNKYSISDGVAPGSMQEFFQENGLEQDMFEDPNDIFPLTDEASIDVEINDLRLTHRGFTIACRSTNASELRKLAYVVLRRLDEEIVAE